MSIETEFESTITNVKNAYQGLDNLGATIPQNKTIENIKNCLDEIYNNLPKTSYAEGSNITLSNTLKGKLDFEDEDGKKKMGFGQTEQKSYTGKNLFPPIPSFNRTINGVTVTSNNGKLTLKGTATASINEAIWGAWGSSTALFTIPRGNYYASGMGNSNASPRLNLVANGTTTVYGGSSLRTFTSDTNITGVFLFIENGTSVDITFEYQIEAGISETSYEPYVGGTASPNPSYQQEIEVVRGNIEVVERGKNFSRLDQSINDRNADITYTENVANNVVGSKTSNNGQFLATFVAQVVSGKAYIISGTSTNCNLYAYKETLGGEPFANISLSTLPKSFTSDYTGTIVLGMFFPSAITGTASIKNFQLEEGSTATDYEPYQTPQTYQLSLGDKELYTDSKIVRVSKNNFKFVDKFEKVRITGTPSSINTSSTNTTRVSYTRGMNNNCILSNRAKCNRLKYATIWSTDEEGFYNDNNSRLVIMRMNKSVIGETNESVSAYLEANETYILGELVTPIETPVTDTTLINQLENFYNSHSFTGTTIIEIDGQLPLIIKVRALKG